MLILPISVYGKVIEVGVGKQYQTFQPAILAANAGDTILMFDGTYSGNSYRENLQGTPKDWITIVSAPNQKVVFKGGGAAFYMVDVAYIRIVGLFFEDQTGNSISIDDGGSYETPSHNIIIENCTWLSMNAPAGSNMIKMAGVDSFSIVNCVFLNGPVSGIGIDLVGCHDGIIEKNYFDKTGAYAIQTKGGSHNITIQHNVFINTTDRTINAGGNTGYPFFRPIDVTYEAKHIYIYANIFRGCKAPISFATAIECQAINNTILNPKNWAFRILQETSDTRFSTCANNTIKNNLIVMPNTTQPAFNIGPNTNPSSFKISHNAWYNQENTKWIPNTPTNELGRLLIDPQIQDTNGLPLLENVVNFSGVGVAKPTHGINGIAFESGIGRSIGAFSQKINTNIFELIQESNELTVSPNPANHTIRLVGTYKNGKSKIYSVNSEVVWEGEISSTISIEISNFPKGIYFILSEENQMIGQFVKY